MAAHLKFEPYLSGDDSRKVPVEDEFWIKDELGDGGYSVVKKGIRKDDDKLFAIKVLKKTKVSKQDLDREVRIWRLACENSLRVVQLYDIYEDYHTVNLVMELMEGGELFAKIVEMEDYSEKYAATIIKQLLTIIKDLHKVNIIHQDLKPENLLLVSKDSMNIKVCDFGLAQILAEDDMELKGIVGSSTYMAPEVVAKKGHSKPVDIYSCGVIMYILLCGYPPFEPENGIVNLEFPEPEWADISDAAKDLIDKMLNGDPSRRPKPEAALKHPWFTDIETLKEVKPLYGTVKTLKRFREIDMNNGTMKEYRGRDPRNSVFSVFGDTISENETQTSYSKEGDVSVGSASVSGNFRGGASVGLDLDKKKEANNKPNFTLPIPQNSVPSSSISPRDQSPKNNNKNILEASKKEDKKEKEKEKEKKKKRRTEEPASPRKKADANAHNDSSERSAESELAENRSPRKKDEAEKKKGGLRFSANLFPKKDETPPPSSKKEKKADSSRSESKKRSSSTKRKPTTNENYSSEESSENDSVAPSNGNGRPDSVTVSISSLLGALTDSPGASDTDAQESYRKSPTSPSSVNPKRVASSPTRPVDPQSVVAPAKAEKNEAPQKFGRSGRSPSSPPVLVKDLPPIPSPATGETSTRSEKLKTSHSRGEIGHIHHDVSHNSRKGHKRAASSTNPITLSNPEIKDSPRSGKVPPLTFPKGIDTSADKKAKTHRTSPATAKSSEESSEQKVRKKSALKLNIPLLFGDNTAKEPSQTKSPRQSKKESEDKSTTSEAPEFKKSGKFSLQLGSKSTDTVPPAKTPREATSGTKTPRESAASGSKTPRDSVASKTPKESNSGTKTPRESTKARDSSVDSRKAVQKSTDPTEKSTGPKPALVELDSTENSKSRISIDSSLGKLPVRKVSKLERDESDVGGKTSRNQVKQARGGGGKKRKPSDILKSPRSGSRKDSINPANNIPSIKEENGKSDQTANPMSNLFGGFLNIFTKRQTHQASNSSSTLPQQQAQQALTLKSADDPNFLEENFELRLMKERANGTLQERKPTSVHTLKLLTNLIMRNKQEIQNLYSAFIKLKLMLQEEAVLKEDLQQRMKIQLQYLQQSLQLEQAKRQLLESVLEKKLAESEKREEQEEQKSPRRGASTGGAHGNVGRAVRLKTKTSTRTPQPVQIQQLSLSPHQ